jgi:hypothetical protein
MAGRGVHEAGAGIVGDVIAIEQRDGELIAAAEGAAGARTARDASSSAVTSLKRSVLHLGLGKGLLGQLIGEDEQLAGTRPEVIFLPP